jgi:transposase, IS6 family
VAVRWYLRYGLSYRDVEELLAERGYRGRPRDSVPMGAAVHPAVDRCGTPLSTHPRRSLVRVRDVCENRRGWVYLYRAIDQYGQVIDLLVSPKRDLAATCRFFLRALEHGRRPAEVTTDQAPAYRE